MNKKVNRIEQFYRKNTKLFHKLTKLLIILVLLHVAFFKHSSLYRISLLLYKNNTMLEDNKQLLSSNENLRKKNHHLQTDNDTIEKFARENLGLQKKGEHVYRFYSTDNRIHE